MNIQEELLKLQDLDYREFHSRLMPTIDKETIIGIRTPVLRKFAKAFLKSEQYEAFLNELPHKYYEENNLHAFLVEQIKDFDEAIEKTERFLPYINNWATCDCFKPKIFKSNKDKLLQYIRKWLSSDKTYTVRYGINQLMTYFLDNEFKEEYLFEVASVKSEEYYVNMMRAWYFATALTKQYNSAVKYIEEKKLDIWTHNKAIQKACESYRISFQTKEYLKKLKVKA